MIETFIAVMIPTAIVLTIAFHVQRWNQFSPARLKQTRNNAPVPDEPRDWSVPRKRKYTQSSADDGCKICYESVECMELYPCGHRQVCEGCVQRLLKYNPSCPFCRQKIMGYHCRTHAQF